MVYHPDCIYTRAGHKKLQGVKASTCLLLCLVFITASNSCCHLAADDLECIGPVSQIVVVLCV